MVTNTPLQVGIEQLQHDGHCWLLQDNMKVLHDQWKQMDAKQKEPYERAAAADSNRYHREVL